MGHKTDQRRYREDPSMPDEQPKAKPISPARARSLARRYLKALDAGKRKYAESDKLLDELVAGVTGGGADFDTDATTGAVGTGIDLGDGRSATIIDQFATGKTKIWKPCGVSRYKLDVSKA